MVKLILLHGIGAGCDSAAWLAALNATLEREGYPAISSDNVIAPQYSHLLNLEIGDIVPLPKPTVRKLTDEEADRERWEYERRQASLLRLLKSDRRHDDAFKLPEFISSIGLEILGQARRYVSSAPLRGCAIRTVVDVLPMAGEVVIVGHSLGSLVAIDVLNYLPPELIVRRLVTIGSPAGLAVMHGQGERLLKLFPLSQLQSWLNVWSVGDPVPYGRGLTHLFPESLDFRIDLGLGTHAADKYLVDAVVAKAVGEATFGALSKDIATVRTDIGLRLDERERLVYTGLAYRHFIADELADDAVKQLRFRGALGEVQRDVIATLSEVYEQENRAMPLRLAELADGRRPTPIELFDSVERSIDILLAIVSSNVIAPYEISISETHRRNALVFLADSLGLPNVAAVVFDSLTKARREVNPREIVSWRTLAMAGAGLCLVAAVPVGLPAGVSGGAAIVAALAGFGPGGMLGGLMTAGTLAAAGGGTVAAALASPSAAAETVEGVVVQKLATVIAQRKLTRSHDPAIWFAFCELQSQLARELKRLATYSDPRAPSLLLLERKCLAVQRAINYMMEHRLVPGLDQNSGLP